MKLYTAQPEEKKNRIKKISIEKIWFRQKKKIKIKNGVIDCIRQRLLAQKIK